MTTDPRLVAALAEAVNEHCVLHGGRDIPCVPAILPAFLADPRTQEWLAERLAGCCPTCEQEPEHRGDEAAAILGTTP
jgi:hypothetical protein